jgi:hypothetical protein
MIRRQFLKVTAATFASVRRLAGRKLFFPEEVPDVIAYEARWLWAWR